MRSFRLSRGNITNPRLGATEPICGHSVNSLLPPRHQSVCLETEEAPGAKVTAGKLSGALGERAVGPPEEADGLSPSGSSCFPAHTTVLSLFIPFLPGVRLLEERRRPFCFPTAP